MLNNDRLEFQQRCKNKVEELVSELNPSPGFDEDWRAMCQELVEFTFIAIDEEPGPYNWRILVRQLAEAGAGSYLPSFMRDNWMNSTRWWIEENVGHDLAAEVEGALNSGTIGAAISRMLNFVMCVEMLKETWLRERYGDAA